MSDTFPVIPDLSSETRTRLLVADYLRDMATLIERGFLKSFALSWTKGEENIAGSLLLDAYCFASTLAQQLQAEDDAATPNSTPVLKSN